MGEDLISESKNITYSVQVVDSEGLKLKIGTDVEFIVDGALYAGNVKDVGIASVDLMLDNGKYTITVINPATNQMQTNYIVVNNTCLTNIDASPITAIYNINKNLVITLKTVEGNPVAGVNVSVDLNGAKIYTTDKNGQVKVSTMGLVPKTYSAKIAFKGNEGYLGSSATVKVTVIKATPKLTAKKKTFKRKIKSKKYAVTLKDIGKAIVNAKITLKVKGKTLKATTNAKGKATFKIKNLKKKAKVTATITYKGDAYYNKVTKKVKIIVK